MSKKIIFNFQSEAANDAIKQPLAKLLDNDPSEAELVKIVENNVQKPPNNLIEIDLMRRSGQMTQRKNTPAILINHDYGPPPPSNKTQRGSPNPKQQRYSTKVSTEYGGAPPFRVTSPAEMSGPSAMSSDEEIKIAEAPHAAEYTSP